MKRRKPSRETSARFSSFALNLLACTQPRAVLFVARSSFRMHGENAALSTAVSARPSDTRQRYRRQVSPSSAAAANEPSSDEVDSLKRQPAKRQTRAALRRAVYAMRWSLAAARKRPRRLLLVMLLSTSSEEGSLAAATEGGETRRRRRCGVSEGRAETAEDRAALSRSMRRPDRALNRTARG